MKLSNNVYNILKWIALVFLPAATVLCGVILRCFEVPNTDIIITIMTAVDTFIGSLLGISSYHYNLSTGAYEVETLDDSYSDEDCEE